jgi:hypothetical protein
VQAFDVARPDRHVRVGAAAGDVVVLLVGPAPLDALLREARLGRHVGLDAQHRGHPGALGLLEEVVRAVQVAVVGDRDGRHTEPAGLGEHLFESGGPVEHGVLGVHVQMHEGVSHARNHPIFR